MNEKIKTPINDVRTVGVPVTDQDRALVFYVEKLGFEKRLDTPVEQLGGRWIEVAPAGGRRRSRSSPRLRASRPASRPGSASRPRTPPPSTPTCKAAALTSVSCCTGRTCQRCSRSVTRTATDSRSSSKPETGCGHPQAEEFR